MLQRKNITLVLVAYICLLSSLVVGFVTGFANNQPSSTYTHHQASTLHRHHTSPLFAKKNKKKPKRAAQTTKGFGAPPPKLEDVLATFKSRLLENAGEFSYIFLLLSYVSLKLQLILIYQSYINDTHCTQMSSHVHADQAKYTVIAVDHCIAVKRVV